MESIVSMPSIEVADKLEPGRLAIEGLQRVYQDVLEKRLRDCHGDERAEQEVYRKCHQEYLEACEPIIKAMSSIYNMLPMTYLVVDLPTSPHS